MRSPRHIRAAAWGAVCIGVAAPLVRRRLRLRPPVTLAAAAVAPVALCVVVPRSRGRDIAVACLQMWAYVAGYEMPNDDPERLRRRVRVRYPIALDRALGLGELPGIRLQRALARRGEIRRVDAVLVWCHWVWFAVPHGTLIYLLLRRRALFASSATSVYAVFDLGLIGYWMLPTAPPWYAAQMGAIPPTRQDDPALRRMMIEHGQAFWKQRWDSLYDSLAGNPMAAMPSLHFATSVMAARQLRRVGPGHGAVGWTYALTLGFALVYLGEHYVVDLLAGLALVEIVRRAGPVAAPALERVGAVVRSLEQRARA